MSANQTPGAAGPAIAAHSKDASTPGQTRASEETGSSGRADRAEQGRAEQGRGEQGADRLSQAADYAAESLREVASQADRALDEVAGFVREQPLATLTLAGVIGIGIGLMIGRRV